MRSEWRQFLARVEKRLIRMLDVITILVCDSVIMAGGYGLIRIAEALSGSGNEFFNAARHISAGVFLLLYLVWLYIDLTEFWKRK